jgi:hypothetical protein
VSSQGPFCEPPAVSLCGLLSVYLFVSGHQADVSQGPLNSLILSFSLLSAKASSPNRHILRSRGQGFKHEWDGRYRQQDQMFFYKTLSSGQNFVLNEDICPEEVTGEIKFQYTQDS